MNTIEFNKKDDNMVRIAREAKLDDLLTKNDYRIYGLKPSNSCKVVIRTHPRNWNHSQVKSFLDGIGVSTSLAGEDKVKKILIGLRRDIRNNSALCAAIIQTIIYSAEGRMKPDASVRINIQSNEDEP